MVDRLVAHLTIRDIDARLLAMHTAFCDAITNGDLTSADAAYDELDALLERRITETRRLAQLHQRKPSE